MFFGKKLSLKFIDPRKIDVDCINNIKSAITKRRQAGYGDVCEYSGGNEPITNIKSIQNIDKQFLFTLTSDSHDNLNKLYDEIKKEFDEMDFKYLIEEQMPIAQLSFENAVSEDFFNEIINKKRNKGSAKIGASIFEREKPKIYIASADILFKCTMEDVNIILNEIIDDLREKNLEPSVKFI